MDSFKWMHPSEVKPIDNGIIISATPHSNCFVNPENGAAIVNAPFYYQETEGDFVLRAKISLKFATTYDAGVLFAYEKDTLWAKACFECTDFGTHAVVSVMTNQFSDDANCINVDGNAVWLQLARKNNVFATHYSLDGEAFLMARLTRLPMQKRIKVGMVAQSPLGQGGDRSFTFISLKHKTVENMRVGK